MGALDCALNVATCVLSGNNREQIHPLAVGASQVEQNVVLCGSYPHVPAPPPRVSSVVFRPVYRNDLVSKLSSSALTRRRKRFAVTSARLFGGSIGMMCWCS
jgi:hypothetical protein